MTEKNREWLRWRKRSEVFERLIGDELVLIHEDRGDEVAYVIRDPAGKLIWKSLAQPSSPGGLIAELGRGRGSPLSAAEATTLVNFVEALASASLIVQVDAGPSVPDPTLFESLPANLTVIPVLERIDLAKLLPSDLALQGVTVGFHSQGHGNPGAAC